MILSSFSRKFALTAHITFSVGWLGAVAGFLALAITGLISQDTQIVRSSYIAMELMGWFVIVPACIGSLLTGLIQSLGTKWGLFQHYWVVVKLFLTVVATIILLLHMNPISYVAEIASKTILSNSDLRGLRIQLIADAGAALLVLLVTTILSVYKPWGKTNYGLSKQKSPQKELVLEPKNKKPIGRYLIIVLICLVLLFIIKHLASGGFGHH